ncbi:hypothetical protein QJS10_CPB17g02371 [Acorus calamus]|uniref:RING-type E3 ubiquitin transferase n=1 Tax=Acorus calamus TaxID=4465 RepID=A0AAV9CX51_ACOCL|nr:hypothetical protein QJS10_CPB17g02371 [Acorus calamus]
MQGKRIMYESLPETFDHESSSSNPTMDQQIYWNNVVSPIGSRNLPGIILPCSDSNAAHVNAVGHESGNLSSWSVGGPSSGGHSLNQLSCDETKMGAIRACPRLEGRRFESPNIRSLENVNIRLQSNQSANEHSFMPNPNSDIPHDAGHYAEYVVSSGQVLEEGVSPRPYEDSVGTEHVSSANASTAPSANFSGDNGYLSEDHDSRPGCLMDGQRLSCKRKIYEGDGQSSVGCSSSGFQRSENNAWHSASARHVVSNNLNIPSPSEQPNARAGVTIRGVGSETHTTPSVVGNAEISRRNFRIRINPTQHDSSPSNLWPTGNPIRHTHGWSINQFPSVPLPYIQSTDARSAPASTSSQIQSPVPPIPYLHRIHNLPWNGAPNPIIGGSSTSIVSAGSRDEAMSRSTPRIISDRTMFVPPIEMRQLPQDPTLWSMANGNVASSSRAGSSSGLPGVHPSPCPTSWVSNQTSPNIVPQRLSVNEHSLLQYPASEPGIHSSIWQRTGHSSSSSSASQDMVLQHGTSSLGHQPLNPRSAFRDGVPMSLRPFPTFSDVRNRTISERICDLIRRGENIRYQDVLILDRSMFHGRAELHDRHRDMRLDVDNMSYEELLALEERIGYVSTGLSEETILKCLKQKKHLSNMVEVEVARTDVEPCCVCQEEYINGDELGTLDCGHDFHTDCIKKWLMLKNLCPICKTTALVT